MLLSVDVEAFEMRSREATLERLIWGRFPEGDFGLERIMSLAEAAGAPLTMFLDYPEFYAYGEGLLDVGREIVRRGHDLNLHLHLDCLPADYFTKRGVAKGGNLNTFDDDTARALVDDVVELHGRVASAPAALRGGGYRYNGSLLRALRSAGVPISSNYNRAAKLQPFDLGPRRQFTWDVGTLELPVASLTGFLNRRYATHLNFNIAPFIAVDEATALANSAAFLDQFYREHGDDAVAVFVMHSWSFLGMDSSGQFSFVNTDAPARLAALLSAWSKWAEFVTAQDVLRLSRNGSLVIDGPLAIPSVNLDVRGASEARDAGARALAGPHSSCPICGTSGAEFVDYNGPKRRCPTCGSTERQRVFVHVYETLRTDFDLANKDVLVVAPAVSERRYLKEQGIRWKSLDIRPEVRADITGDLCNLSDVPDASFDAVIASFVLTCVHDVDACLSELSRILRPGGKLLTCDPLRFGQATIEHQDVARITAWYGQEPYEKYRVGCFRHLGEVDLQRRFEAHGFSVRPMEWLDVPTNSRWVWYVSTKPGSTSTRASASEEGLEGLKQRVAQLEKELQRQRQLSASLEAQLEKAQNTLSFRLGYLLLHAPKSFAALRRLPAELWALHREAKIRRAKRSANSPDRSRPSASERREEEQRVADEAARVFLEKGMAAAVTYVEGAFASQRDCAETLGRLAKSLRSSAPHEAASLARRAHELDPTPNRAKSLALLEFARGAVSTPAALLDELPSDLVLTPGERDRVAEIRGLAAMRHRPPTIPVRSPRASYTPVARRALYLTASAQPFHLSGYTVRTHAVVRATRDAGFDVVTALRPGYPADRGFTPAEPHHELGGVTYHHVAGPPLRRTPLDRYVAEASSSLTAFARGARPQLIHAASNYVNALPALIAARRLGVPFVYEVRGMWELTAASRFPDWETSERFEIDRDLEGLVAREADLVFTLTEGLSKELVARGVSPEKIVLLPNAVDPDAFAPRPRDEALATQFGIGEGSFTLAYAGSLLGYEGLDDALRAVALLASRGVDVRFLIAGDGEAMEALRKLTADLGIERRVTFLGRLLPSEIPMIWSLADAAAFPRKPFKVCELVSPLKPLEPMTMGIPVVVSNVAALKEMVRDGQTGLVHRADDAVDLAEKLGELQRDATLRSRLGQAARAAVLQERTWESAGRRVVTHYERLLRRADVGGATDPALHGVRV